ncbi:glycosyltransferase family 20 protein [Auriscalpium vulgare]|uniref:Glycosyltransferase family 20 protein n=1 Tax=Auriscalpium vulgare TaxID=40419 RepID=A0ACB8SC55_9AGAM|nr:glycosyltransferase family 20 protein [Auriscalpium vulgare]
MSSIRNHRVIIASLFLPNTAVLGESHPPTPELHTAQTHIPAFHLVHPSLKTPLATPGARTPGPLKSIVEDLKDKSRVGTPAVSPGIETFSPLFANFSQLTPNGVPTDGTKSPAINPFFTDVPAPAAAPDRARPRTPSYIPASPVHIPHRVQRKNSRSSARRPHSDSPIGRQYHIEPNPHGNGGLTNAITSVSGRLKRKLWVGTLGVHTDGFREPLRRNIDRRMSDESDSHTVWIPDEEFTDYYDMFCHQVLWPCLHYVVPDAPKTKFFYESKSFSSYVKVNQRFADAIVENYQDGDIVWVNDYHLMLVPSLVRAKLPSAIIGFFMHVAFPSSEIFRCLSVRESLLRGVLSADLIGFQTANYARHFRQTVSRILALETLPKGIQAEDRFVDVAVFPMGIDVHALREKKREPEVAHWVKTLTERYQGVKLVVGRDKLDEVQGVRHKLLAFETFLDKHPEFHQKVVLIQVALQTSEESEHHGGVADVVARINSRFSTLTYQPVVFLHTEDLSFSQYLALLTVADAFLVTSMREGMALRTHEFVECQEERHRPLILSEFTGSYTYSGFRSCIAINPWDRRNTANAIHQALTMDEEEAFARWEDLHNHVVTQTSQAFVTSFLTRCLRTNIEHLQGDSSVAYLDLPRLLPRYKHSQRRLILIDLEDTLWLRHPRRAGAPPAEALDVVKRLAEDSKNEVWLLSGLTVKELEEVSKATPKVGLVAENGCFVRPIPNKIGEATWITMVTNFNLTWKSACVEILNYFTERTPGSYVEEREASVVWRYFSGDPNDSEHPDRAWARRQAAEAQNHIFDSLGERYGLRIIPGESSFLVLPNYISRSTAVGAILHAGGPAASPLAGRAAWVAPETLEADSVSDDSAKDFVLAIGSDEKLLRRLNELGTAETCSTSEKGTDARWKVGRREVVGVLQSLVGVGVGVNAVNSPQSPVL